MVGQHNYREQPRTSPAALSNPAGPHLFTARAILDRLGYPRPDVSNDPEHAALTPWRPCASEVCCRYSHAVTPRRSNWRNYGLARQCRAVLAEARGLASRPLPSRLSSRLRSPLIQELTHRTAQLEASNSELHETLDQQMATSEILG